MAVAALSRRCAVAPMDLGAGGRPSAHGHPQVQSHVSQLPEAERLGGRGDHGLMAPCSMASYWALGIPDGLSGPPQDSEGSRLSLQVIFDLVPGDWGAQV